MKATGIKISHTIFLIIILFILKACSTSVCGCAFFNTDITLNYVDQNGEQLINTDHPHAINYRNFDMYYVVKGKKERVHEFEIIERDSGNYYINLYPNIIRGQKTAITYIEFGDSTLDTIKVQYKAGDGLEIVNKVWYNQELRWEIKKDGGGPRFTVTRHLE